MGFFKKDFKNKNLIVLDIGSQFLKALLLEINGKSEEKNLLGWSKESFSGEVDKLLISAKKAIVKVERKTGVSAEQIFLGLGTEFLKGKSTTLCYQRENPTQEIDLTELRNLIQKTQWRAYDQLRKDFSLETSFPESEIRLINAYIVDIKVDNAHIPNPLGFEGKTICLTIFNNYTSRENLESLLKLSAELELELRGIDSQSYALFYSLGLGNYKEDTLVVDVGGKVTDIVLVKNRGEVIDMKSFNLGGYLFTKALAEFLGLDLDEAETIKVRYSKGEVSDAAKKKLDSLFAPNVVSWFNGIKVVLKDFYETYHCSPKTILFCGGGSVLPGMAEILKRRGGFKTKIVSPKEITNINNKTKFQNIGSLALAALAAESPETEEFYPLLKRALRLIQS